jgi:hypothetical protein
MFKAKVIEGREFYKAHSRQGQIFLITLPVAGIISYALGNFDNLWNTANIAFTIAALINIPNLLKVRKLYGVRTIEINENEISIRSKKGENDETFDLHKVKSITLKDNYIISQLSFVDSLKAIAGNPTETYLILSYPDHDRRIDFDIDSYYLLKKLNDIIKIWEKKGYKIYRPKLSVESVSAT